MRLKSIKLAGFKSFVDPTTVPFQSKMTAIVGPNGCGKSNIIDAVRWVMGESNAKHLRGELMTDVIFNGSVSRKPVSRASIELVFDNSDGRASGEYARFSEISVKREVTREGQSKYFLNGTNCRRRDVTDLFLGTGLGPRSYAIIEQGMIARIVEARPEELRTYVEEAAGVSKYKERRRETELRILRTRENLNRLNDLSDELGRQLARLKRQADAAEEYKKIKDKSRELEALLLWYELKVEKKNQSIQVSEKKDYKIYLDKLTTQFTSNERIRTEAQVGREDTSQSMEKANSDYYTQIAVLSQMEAKKNAYDEQVKQLGVDQNRVDKKIAELQAMMKLDREDGIAAEQNKAQIQPQLDVIQSECESLDQSIASFEKKLDIRDLERQQLTSELSRLKIENTRLEIEQKGLVRQKKNESDRLQNIANILLKLADTDPQVIDKLIAKHLDLSERLSEESARDQEFQNRYDEASGIVYGTEHKLREAEGHLQSAQAEFGKAKRRLDVELRSDGKEIDAWMSCHSSVKGHLIEYIEVNAGDRQAFEAAYPEWIAAFVVDNLEDFDFESIPAGVRIISCEQVSFLPKQFSKVLEPFTLEGEGYTETGLRFGPGWVERVTGRASGILDLRARLPVLKLAQSDAKKVTVQLAHELVDLRRRCDEANEGLKHQRQLTSQLETELVQLNNRLAGLEAKKQEIQDSRDRLIHEKTLLETAQLSILVESKQLDEQISAVIPSRLLVQEQFKPLEELLSSDKSSLIDFRDERNKLATLRSDLRVQIERFTGIKSRSDAQLQRIEVQLSSLQNELKMILKQRGSLTDNPVVKEGEINQAVKESQSLQQNLLVARQALGESEHNLRRLDSQRLELEGVREAANVKFNAICLREQAIEIELTRLEREFAATEPNKLKLFELEVHFGARHDVENEVNKIADQLERLGPINLVALDEYKNELARRVELDRQHAELTEALETLEDAIRKIDRETRSLFKSTFDAINQSFGNMFPKLFGGGEAWLILTDADLLTSGVTIMARPPGKRNSSIYLLSGGEKALTALSLVFSIFHLNPAPFCLLDEVDAPLDDANVERYARAVTDMSQTVQFIYITHNKIAMEHSEHLMGVTMSEPGVSRLVSVDIERAIELSTSE